MARHGTDPGRDAPPAGTVTFLFTDIEGSTRLAAELEHDWPKIIDTHNTLLRRVWAAHHGYEVGTAGDSFFVSFSAPGDAIAAAVAAQRVIGAHDWAPHQQLRVRMGMHTGDALVHNRDYVGLQVHVAARVSGAAHGGQILVSDATRTAAGDLTGVEYLDVGFHRLKDLPSDVRLFQVAAAGLDRSFAPVRSLELFRNNVPAPTSTFIGRSDDLRAVHDAIDTSRLVTLLGPGGAGKTRLATQVALERLDRHVDGVWMVELDTLADATDAIVSAIADVFRVGEQPGTPLQETVIKHLHDRELLLVVDNCEHLVGSAAAVVQSLLDRCPRLRVLATSREPLALTGEQTWPVAPLPVSDEHSESVQLFFERVRLVRPDALTRGEAVQAAINVCRQLDGLPLAIELAAARARSLTVEQIADRLDDRWRLLTTGARTAMPRQQTLRGAVDWSYDLLDERERRVFARLSVFAGEFDIDAAETVCAGDEINEYDVFDLVSSLVEKSLVGGTPAGRFRMLRTIRAYAGERLREAGAQEHFLARHATWVADLLRSHRTSHGFDVIVAHHDDLNAALAWAFDHDVPMATELTRLAAPHWSRGARWGEAVRWLETLRTRAQNQHDAAGSALSLAQFYAYQGRFDDAQAQLEHVLAVADELDDHGFRRAALCNLGVIASYRGDLQTATSLLEGALAETGAVGSDHPFDDEALAFTHLAVIAHQRGDAELAEARARRALEFTQQGRLENAECVPVLLNLLGLLAAERGDRDAARGFYHDALRVARETNDRRAMVYLAYCLGTLALDSGDLSGAAAQLLEAVELGVDAESQADLVESIEASGRLAATVGAATTAAQLLAAASRLRDDVGLARNAAEQAAHEALTAAVQRAAGDVIFADHWSIGRQRPLDATVAVTLDFLRNQVSAERAGDDR